MRPVVTKALPLTMYGVLLLSALPAVAQDRTRVDLFKPDGSRQGYAIVDERTGRVDVYDKDSRRTGYGVVQPDGRVDHYRIDGSRAGTGILRDRRPPR